MPAKKPSPLAHAVNTDLEHEQLTSLVNSMVDGFIAVNERIHVTMYNGAALNLLDLNGSISGKSLSKVLQPLDKNNQPLDILELVRSTTIPTVSRDLKLSYTDGSIINLYLSIAPVRLGYGKKGDRGYVLLLRDITREKSLEEERNEFISVVSHELRTPIAIAEGNISNAQFIASKKNDVSSVEAALAQAHNQVLFLADMINDLSTLSRAERGSLSLEIEAINVHDLTVELGNNYSPQAESKGLTLKTELDPSLELLQSSKLYVREVLQNFITNSIKYTETGSVTISAKPLPKGVEFLVSDTGIGISKSDQEKIFDKFFRSEDYRTRSNNGTGLGLYVTMKLARLLHAEIEVHSKLNHGSTFTIFIPNLK